MCHVWALKGSGLFADWPGFLGCMVEGAIAGWSSCMERYSFQTDIIENIIEYVFLSYWRSQLASFWRFSFTSPRCGERAACFKSTICALWLSHCPSSVWVAISQVETVRAMSAYSGHLKTLDLRVLFTVCHHLSLSVSSGPGLPRCIVITQLLFRFCLNERMWTWGSVTSSCLGASSQLPQSPVCAAFFSYLTPTQTCSPYVSHLHLIFCQPNLKVWLMALSCLNKPLETHLLMSPAKRPLSHDNSEVSTVRNRNLSQGSPKTRGISKHFYQIYLWPSPKTDFSMEQNLPFWLN